MSRLYVAVSGSCCISGGPFADKKGSLPVREVGFEFLDISSAAFPPEDSLHPLANSFPGKKPPAARRMLPKRSANGKRVRNHVLSIILRRSRKATRHVERSQRRQRGSRRTPVPDKTRKKGELRQARMLSAGDRPSIAVLVSLSLLHACNGASITFP